MKRFLLLLLLLAALPAWSADKPNVLFIAIDDLRPELGCYGSDLAITPSLDKLASKGLLFERAYCNIPVCGASRASLFTGMYPIGTKRFANYFTRADEDAPNAVTLPQAFRQAGYTTISNGKIFHHADDTEKRSWSVPAWRPTGRIRGVLPETRKKLSKKGRGYIVEAADVQDNAYPDGKTARKTMADLRELKREGKPFFLACGFYKPHLPFYAPKKYWDLYDREAIPLADNRYTPKDAPPALRGSTEYRGYHLGDLRVNSDAWHRVMKHGYLACVSYIDTQIGKVLTELDELGLADNTIVVVWGDHGFHLGEHNFWGKHNTLNHATRVPLIIHVPQALLKPDATANRTDALVESTDIFPTLCELAGVKPPDTLQGKSLQVLFTKPNAVLHNAIYTRFKSADALVNERYAYTRYSNGGEMLFDHLKDPEENHNVINDAAYRDAAERLRKELDGRIKQAKGE